MRDIQEVGQEILVHVTSKHVTESIERLLGEAIFRAPEIQYLSWGRMQQILILHYKKPTSSNEALEVFSIFTTLSKEELLKYDREDTANDNL